MTKAADNLLQRGDNSVRSIEDKLDSASSSPPVSPADPPPSLASDPRPPQKRRRWILLLVIGLAVIGSIAAELICGRSICACLRQFGEPIDEFMVALLPLASAVSVSKIADTIGVCSVLIGWIYASLDKTELGIRYSTLADSCLPGYHIYVAAHFIGVLLCIWLSAAGLVESAVLVLLGVLYDSWLQWDVLWHVILSSKHRRNLAMEVWRTQTGNAKDAKSLKELALEIARVVAEKNIGETLPLQKQLVEVLIRYVEQYREEDPVKGLENAIEEISWMFGYLFEKKEMNEQVFLSRYVFSYCEEDCGDYGAICAAYILWLIRDKVAKCEQTGRMEEEVLAKARNFLEIVAHGEIKKKYPDILRNWRMIFVSLTWILIMNGSIRVNEDLLNTWPREKPPCPEPDRVLLQAVANVYFGESGWEKSLSKAILLMWMN